MGTREYCPWSTAECHHDKGMGSDLHSVQKLVLGGRSFSPAATEVTGYQLTSFWKLGGFWGPEKMLRWETSSAEPTTVNFFLEQGGSRYGTLSQATNLLHTATTLVSHRNSVALAVSDQGQENRWEADPTERTHGVSVAQGASQGSYSFSSSFSALSC